MGYDIIIQNSATKQEYLISGLTDSGNRLAYVFEDFVMPEGAQSGEYYGALIWNGRGDVEYEFKDVLLETILHTGEGDVQLKDLRPEVFLMRYGTVEASAVYKDNNTEYYYYGRK